MCTAERAPSAWHRRAVAPDRSADQHRRWVAASRLVVVSERFGGFNFGSILLFGILCLEESSNRRLGTLFGVACRITRLMNTLNTNFLDFLAALVHKLRG